MRGPDVAEYGERHAVLLYRHNDDFAFDVGGPRRDAAGAAGFENDAFGVCGAFIPDQEKVISCIASNENRLREPCRKVMARYPLPKRRRAESASHTQTAGQGE